MIIKSQKSSLSLGEDNLEDVVGNSGGGTKGHLEGVVNASGHELQVLIAGVSRSTWNVQIREYTVDMETSFLTQRGGTKYSDHWDLFYRTGPELRVAYVQVLNGRGIVGLDGDNATAEGAGREGGGGGRGGGTHARFPRGDCHPAMHGVFSAIAPTLLRQLFKCPLPPGESNTPSSSFQTCV